MFFDLRFEMRFELRFERRFESILDGFVSRSAHNVTIRIGCPAKVAGGLLSYTY